MAATAGRNVLLSVGGNPVAGLRTKNLTVNKENIDITDDNSLGWKVMLAEDGERSIEMACEGIRKDDDLLAIAMTDNNIVAATLTYPDGGSLAGNFKLSAYAEGIAYKEGVTFSCTLTSTGVITYTPARLS